ncbi:MAG: redox-sensing transcriptional repressor Rex [Anaerolineaceae bacterium]|nr:redox-sensing transcriptional repressor Rex [Anaerolineaceae bacterium]
MAGAEVPDIVIGRLPIYLRALTLLAEAGQEFTSSQELGQILSIGSAQIRKDLSHFGEFGKQGTGYEVSYLRDQISKILHVDRDWSLALVGFGDLGQAIAHYGGFSSKGFHINAIFDADPGLIGQPFGEGVVRHVDDLKEVIAGLKIRMAIVAVPAAAAQEVADMLIEADVRAILNYAPITLSVPSHVYVQYIDPVSHLQRMTYYLA